MELAAYFFAMFIGISLGLIGAGGSILTVPVLVYLAHVEPVLATGYSLFVVGSTALVGGIQNAWKKRVAFKTALVFGIPSIITVYATRAWIMPWIPAEINIFNTFAVGKGELLLLLFAGLMIITSVSMIRDKKDKEEVNDSALKENRYIMILLEGVGVGMLTGLVGAGGGFLIIPALVLFAGLEMKLAVGTSLFIIAAKSLIGFMGDIQTGSAIDWTFLLTFTACSIAGIFVGIWLNKFIDGKKLKSGFGWFVLIMGMYMIIKETVLR
ncbi:MAG: sulfite exporter TauE/SafE family protein [Pyrinomonadaceae bacterium]